MKVDTNAAREFSNGGDRYTGAEVRLWVHNLADEVDRLRAAVVVARDGYVSERATGLPVLETWRERTIEMLDKALDA